MKAADLMKRSENALRTGQTVNLFPVLARRTLQQIDAERKAARIELAVSQFVPVFVRVWNALAERVGEVMETTTRILQEAADAGGYDDVQAMLAAAEAEAEMLHRWGGNVCTCPEPVPLTLGYCGYCRRPCRTDNSRGTGLDTTGA